MARYLDIFLDGVTQGVGIVFGMTIAAMFLHWVWA